MQGAKVIRVEDIRKRIYAIHNKQVMFDSDLAAFYGVETKRLDEQVKRNIERFPEEFCFRLTKTEFDSLRSQNATSKNDTTLRLQNATSSKRGGRRYQPYVFTEQGVAMLSAILKSDRAIKVSIQIINAFVEMRHFLLANAQIFQKLDMLELKQIQSDKKIDSVLNALESKKIMPKQGIFFDGQIFDAYKFVCGIIRSAEQSIKLIDGYIDETVLNILSKRKINVTATIYTISISSQLALDLKKYNEQYSEIIIKEFKNSHDRFMIIDDKIVYHIGASIKDLEKKWFAFSKMDIDAFSLLSKLK